MRIWWCRTCGLESTSPMERCPSCGSAMQVSELEWLAPDDEGEETVFELEPEPIERAAIVDALIHEKIRHRWETDNELVVADTNADAVDEILDEVLGVETRSDQPGIAAISDDEDVEDYEEDDYEGDGGEGYGVLSKLYIATDRLQSSRDDEDVMEFATATGVVLMSPPPFGVDEETWADIQSSARNLATVLESDSSAPVDADLRALRNQLQGMV